MVKRVLEKSSRQTRESLNKLLNYPESSAGSLMTPEYVRLREGMTVSDAFAAIRRQGENAETVYTCYVVERNRLKGVVSARSLLLADPSTPITDIMDDNVVAVKVTDDQEFVAREMQRYDFTAMPVLDNEGMFVGIITIDDAIDVLTDETRPSTAPTMAETRSSLPRTRRKSLGSTSPSARPRTMRVLIWLPQLPAVSISMGMKETSRGRLTKASS